MDQQWSPYAESPLTNRQARYAPHTQAPQQLSSRDPTLAAAMNQASSAPSRAQSINLSSPQNQQPGRGMYNGDGDGDVQMEDADPYNRKRPGHSRMHSAQLAHQEGSSAARRYSPMNLSPSSPYAATPQQNQGHFAAFSPQMTLNSQSPTRSSFQAMPNHGYYSPPGTIALDCVSTASANRLPASRPHAPQLPPLQSTLNPEGQYPQNPSAQLSQVFSREQPKSPRHPPPVTQLGASKGPVPKFQKCLRVSELQPVINSQPPFRRANPEGGFLSVSCLYCRSETVSLTIVLI